MMTFGFLTAVKPVLAFSITYNFTVQITSNTYEAQGLLNGTVEQGSFTYDDSQLTGIGSEYASKRQGNLALTFDFLNQTYIEKDDLNYGSNAYLFDYPVAFFENGTLQGLDFLVVPSKLQPPKDALGFRIFGNAFYAGATDNFNSGSLVGTVAYSVPTGGSNPSDPNRSVAGVPEPSEVGGAIVAAGCLAFFASKRWQSKRAKR
ncbi:MAG: hypothetical protein ACAF41_22865 [Leptolyngbya sp. BL-A-14]